jgi:hypothetical protein
LYFTNADFTLVAILQPLRRFACMDFTLVKIRLLQLRREIQSLGIFYTLFFAALAVGLVAVIFSQYQQRPNSWAAAGILVALAVAIQIGRTDKEFIFRHLPNPQQAIFTEYFLLSLPFTLPCLLTDNWYCFPAVAAGFLAVAGLQFHVSGKHTLLPGISRLTGKQNFEWTSGVRKTFPALALVYLLALVFCWVPVLPLFFLWVLTVFATGFYLESEPLMVLQAIAQSPVEFLRKKIVAHGKLLLMLELPALLVVLINQPQFWYVYVVFILLQFLLLSCAILIKYSTYEPNRYLGPNSILVMVAAAGAFIPFLLPLPLVISIRYWRKATQRLHVYLDD